MSLERIMKEKISADHLLYVSMKYTKTCDVMLNLIERWRSMIEFCLDAMLDKAKKKKLVGKIPEAPRMKIEMAKQVFKKEPTVIETIQVYEFFKRVSLLERVRENEFRKNVCLTILDSGKETRIDMDKLKEYAELLERFIKLVREYLSK